MIKSEHTEVAFFFHDHIVVVAEEAQQQLTGFSLIPDLVENAASEKSMADAIASVSYSRGGIKVSSMAYGRI